MRNDTKSLGWLNKTVMFCNHLAVIALLIAYCSPYVSPESIWHVAFFGLLYPFIVGLNALFILYWIIRLRIQFLYSLLFILAGFSVNKQYIQSPSEPQSDSLLQDHFKVMSYNVKLFDLYDWNNNHNTRNGFFDVIKNESPDIMCLQEFYSSDGTKLDNLATLKKLQKAKNVHVVYTSTLRETDHWGGAIFSAYPIIKKGKIDFGVRNNNLCMFADVKINMDTIRVYNVHLQSIHFDKQDYEFVDEFINQQNTDELSKSKDIIKRLKLAYERRAKQAVLLANHIKKSPYSVIVCGDFNDVPLSYAYHTISKNLNDSYVESGGGLGRTYIGKFPSIRIDYILHSKDLQTTNFQTTEKQLSDHYPISCYFTK